MADKEYGVAEMAKHLGLSEAVVRGKLRKANVKRAGKSYSWKSASAMQADARKIDTSDGGGKKKSKKTKKASSRKKRASSSEGVEAEA